MKRIREIIEQCFAGVAFAEANEHEEALVTANIRKVAPCTVSTEDIFVAATFAEANCHEMAHTILGHQRPVQRVIQSDFLRSVGLSGVPIWYGVTPATN